MYRFGLTIVLCVAFAASASAEERPAAEQKLLEELQNSDSGIGVSTRNHEGRVVALDVTVGREDLMDSPPKQVSSADLALVFRKVRGFASLESLHLAGVGTGFDDASAAELHKLPRLKSLSYTAGGDKDKPGTTAAFLKAASGVKLLESLELSLTDADLDDAALAELAKFQKLATFDYSARYFKVKPKPMAPLLRTLSGLKWLDTLHLTLHNAELDDAAAAELAKMSKLRTLSYASWVEVLGSDSPEAPFRIEGGPKPAVPLLRAVASLESLEQLSIHTGGLTADAVRELKACKKLKGLVLGWNDLPRAVLEEVIDALKLEDAWTHGSYSTRLPIRGFFFPARFDIDLMELRKVIPFDPEEGDDRLTRLKKLRFKAGWEGLQVMLGEFKVGRGTTETLFEAAMALKKSGLELAPTPEAKRAFLQIILNGARAAEMLNHARYESMRLAAQDLFRSVRVRLDMEIELARLDEKPVPPK